MEERKMRASVGVGGKNVPADVKYVQFLLSDHLAQGNGQGLAIDGICGPKTQAAITKFQQIKTGLVDGRVDPGGPTIKRLEYLHFGALASAIRNISYLTWSAHRPPILLDDTKLFAQYLKALRDSLEG
jgi:peptidoglycan hydrolase-like protein with peptidoglycan-binding domain